MRDIYLIKRARKLMQQPRPYPLNTVSELNILERQLKEPSKEVDEYLDIAIKDMNIVSSWGSSSGN